MRPSRTTALLAAIAVLACAPTAQASVSVVVSGDTLQVTGGAGADTPRFRYYDPSGAGQPGYSRIFEPDGVSDPLPPACSRIADPEGQAPEDVVFCEDGGTAASLNHVVLNLLGGNDDPQFLECFSTYAIALGEGDNDVTAPACATGTFTVTSGAGEDFVRGPTTAGSLIAIDASLGDGEDDFTGGDGNAVVHGGGGPDRMFGGAGVDQLFGDDGNDIAGGYGGNDTLDGGAGDDRLDFSPGISNNADPGADDYRGGSGSDTLYLNAHAAAMSISLNEVADDGSPGEGDNIRNDIEDIRGTTFGDTFTGNDGPNKFDGAAGDDVARGGGGNDDIYGDSGQDTILGEAGADRVQGGPGADSVDGGAGLDEIYGDIAGCSVFCSIDSDSLFARDGEQDRVDCGGGADTAQVDTLDIVAFCASVSTGAVPAPGGTNPGPGGTGGPGGGAPGTAFSYSVGAKPSIKKGTKLTVTCPAACTITASLKITKKLAVKYKLGRKAMTIGTVRGTVLAAGQKKLTLKLTTKARGKLRKARKLATTLDVSVKDAAGKTTKRSRSVSLGK